MIKAITYIVLMSLLLSCNCTNKLYCQNINCEIINNLTEYLKKNVKELKDKNIDIFDSTDALPFANFSQELHLYYPFVNSQLIDSLDHNSISQKIDCVNENHNSTVEFIFSNVYKNLIICEWFYIGTSHSQNLDEIRRFKEAKNYLFELGRDYKIKRVFTKTIQYE